MLTKQCTACKIIKALAEFYKRSASPDGLQPSCKICMNAKEAAYRSANKEKIYAQQAVFRAANKEIAKARSAKWYAENKERAISYNSACRKADPEKAKARLAAWVAKNKTRVKALRAAYAKANPHVFSASNARRKAAKLQATPAWANRESIAAIYQEAARLKMQVDHTVPLQSDLVCGLHCESNLQILSKRENIIKGNRYWPDMP